MMESHDTIQMTFDSGNHSESLHHDTKRLSEALSACQAQNAMLTEQLSRYQLILEHSGNVLLDWNVLTNYIDFSDTWEKIFGYPPPSGYAHDIFFKDGHVHPDDVPLLLDRVSLMEKGSNYEVVEVRNITTTGRYRWCRLRASAIRDESGKLTRIVGVIANIDREKAAHQELRDRAERDALTDLLNKEAGRRHAEDYLNRFVQGATCALLILDLDNFKQINDRYGHLFGDAVISRVAREIKSQFKTHDIQCRIGGDEFMVLVRGVSDRALLSRICRRLHDALLASLDHMHVDVQISCSIGIALCPEHGTRYVELFSRADQALYMAKQKGKDGFCFYDEAIALPAHTLAPANTNTPIDSDQLPGLGKDDLAHRIFRKLYMATDLSAAIDKVIGLMGSMANVSRVYIFENNADNTLCSNTFEWCNTGVTPEIHNLQNISYETDIPHYQDNFNEEGIFYCPDVRKAPRAVYDIVKPQGILSMLQCAIRENGVFRGYIGFDECQKHRFWTQEEIDVLTYCSEILSVFILKLRGKN